ncbi:MAG: transglycosylase SLT domain-containing protein [Bacteroidales bacterium]|nr:transglycosylase SLT domain-containing protein [Bacteroidales bacterium]
MRRFIPALLLLTALFVSPSKAEAAPNAVPDSLEADGLSDAVITRRLKEMNSFISIPYNATVRNNIILYAHATPLSMGRIMGLAEYYLPIFEEAMDRYGLPLELKYLPVIESKLDPAAVSPAGAKGLWQFIYTTAKRYGLKITSYEDERLDVVKSTDAAARYLRDSYKELGDWVLAICAYNCGSGNVKKAIQRAGSRRFWDIYPYLPRETRGYVPAFVGAMYAIRWHKEYGIVPVPAELPVAVDTFEIKQNLHFKQIHEVAGIPVATLREVNPQYIRDIVPGDEGTCILMIPEEWTSAFVAAEGPKLYAHRAAQLLNAQKPLPSAPASKDNFCTIYVVKEGDNLYNIAKLYPGVSARRISEYNNLPNDSLRPGMKLKIPR